MDKPKEITAQENDYFFGTESAEGAGDFECKSQLPIPAPRSMALSAKEEEESGGKESNEEDEGENEEFLEDDFKVQPFIVNHSSSSSSSSDDESLKGEFFLDASKIKLKQPQPGSKIAGLKTQIESQV